MRRHTVVAPLVFYCLVLCLLPNRAEGQSKFKVGVQAGGNLSQVDGDSFEGFHKLGVRFGLRGEYELLDSWDLVLELNYEEKGSFFGSHAGNNQDRNKTIRLEYIELPLLIKWSPIIDRPLFVEGGASLAYLIRDEIVQGADDPSRAVLLADRAKFRATELNVLAGVGWQFTERIAAHVRYSYGIQALVRDDEALAEYLSQNPDGTTFVPLFHLRNYQISMGVLYMIQPGKGGKNRLGCPSF